MNNSIISQIETKLMTLKRQYFDERQPTLTSLGFNIKLQLLVRDLLNDLRITPNIEDQVTHLAYLTANLPMANDIDADIKHFNEVNQAVVTLSQLASQKVTHHV